MDFIRDKKEKNPVFYFFPFNNSILIIGYFKAKQREKQQSQHK